MPNRIYSHAKKHGKRNSIRTISGYQQEYFYWHQYLLTTSYEIWDVPRERTGIFYPKQQDRVKVFVSSQVRQETIFFFSEKSKAKQGIGYAPLAHHLRTTCAPHMAWNIWVRNI